MKKRQAVAAFIVVMSGAVQGCSFEQIGNDISNRAEINFELSEEIKQLHLELPIEEMGEQLSSEIKKLSEASGTETESTETENKDTENTDTVLEMPKETISGENSQKEKNLQVSEVYYAYHLLDSDKQKLYLEIYDILRELKQDVKLTTKDKTIIEEVFTCVMNDHPELFFVEGYKCTEYSLNSKITSISFTGTYNMTIDEAVQKQEEIEAAVNQCITEIIENEDEYYTVKRIYEYLINNTEYNNNAENNQNICSVFLQNESVCQGYAKAMQYMLQKMDIPAFLVTGFTNGERHAWNLVRVNGKYYYIDTTWGDASYSFGGETQNSQTENVPHINYDYFLVTTDEITRTHSFEKVVPMPECNSVTDNYFHKEGLYFENYDAERLGFIFGDLWQGQTKYVTIKCADETVQEEMLEKLITDKQIFDFALEQKDTIAYTINKNQKTISFWIIETK